MNPLPITGRQPAKRRAAARDQELTCAGATISKLWLPIQQYIDEIKDSKAVAVYHYTDLQGALGILQSGRIWFTERTHLNDPTEISHGIEIASRALRDQGRKADADGLKDNAERVLQNFCFFSASFSFVYDGPCQWSKYADNGRGVCLSFKAAVFDKPKAFIDRFITDNPTVFAGPMSYDSYRLQSLIASIIKCWDGGNIDELCDHIFMISSMFKADKWGWEKEYRFFVHHRYTQIISCKYYKTREQDGRVIPYLELPIQGWHSPNGLPIYRLCVGPTAMPATKARVAAAIRKMRAPPREGVIKSDPSRCAPSPF